MKVPIRMLGIATSVIWVLLIAFIVLAAYSVTDLRFNVDEPQFNTDSNGQLVLNLPLIIDNGGYYSLKEFQISTVFSNVEGLEISRADTFIPIIHSGEIVTINHNVPIDMEEIFSNDEKYLFEDNELQVSLSVGLNFAEVLPSQISTNFTFPWGAPLSDFEFGKADVNRFNLTHSIITIPMSFANHAFIDVVGSISVELCNEENSVLSETQKLISVSPQTSYEESLVFIVPIPDRTLTDIQNSHFNVYFSTLLFEHGPLVIPYE
ncbi:hypothetical protein MUO66_05825 [Candidatus Bathyarchaeota archaeon]|nr:hypothetical protein [Candidatus Bathyarchaeota archaeon]